MFDKRTGKFIIFASHGVLIYVVFVIIPILLCVVYSFTNMNPLYPDWEFVGFDNYVSLKRDSDFWNSVTNTVVFAFIVTVASNVLGIIIALMLNYKGKFYYLLRTMFFAPQVMSGVVVGFIWAVILTDNGILNKILDIVHLNRLKESWLADPQLALYSISVVVIWQMLGFCVVIYLATLQSISKELYEAAELDGCTKAQKFFNITFPLLAPGMTINVTMLLITMFKIYDQIAVLTAGGPGNATETLAFKIVYTGFTKNEMGYGSSMSVVLFLIIGLLSVVTTMTLRKREVQH